MSIVRVGTTKQYADNWDNIFGGAGSRTTTKKKPANVRSPPKPRPRKSPAEESESEGSPKTGSLKIAALPGSPRSPTGSFTDASIPISPVQVRVYCFDQCAQRRCGHANRQIVRSARRQSMRFLGQTFIACICHRLSYRFAGGWPRMAPGRWHTGLRRETPFRRRWPASRLGRERHDDHYSSRRRSASTMRNSSPRHCAAARSCSAQSPPTAASSEQPPAAESTVGASHKRPTRRPKPTINSHSPIRILQRGKAIPIRPLGNGPSRSIRSASPKCRRSIGREVSSCRKPRAPISPLLHHVASIAFGIVGI